MLKTPTFNGPAAVRQDLVELAGQDWVVSYIDPCRYLYDRSTIVARHAFASEKIRERIGRYLDAKGIKLVYSTVKPESPDGKR